MLSDEEIAAVGAVRGCGYGMNMERERNGVLIWCFEDEDTITIV